MRRVAGRAAFHPRCRVLEYERPAFFRMALGARFRAGLLEFVQVIGAVRRMAIRAFHRAFRHPVVRSQRERGSHVAVALVTQLRLILLQQAAVQPTIFFWQRGQREKLRLSALYRLALWIVRRFHQMDRMAIEARDSVQRMARMIELRLLLAGLVALHAARRVRFRRAPERKNQLVGRGGFCIVAVRRFLRVRVSLTRAMAHLAADDGIFVLWQSSVNRLAKLDEFGFVTAAAPVVARIASAGLLRNCLCHYRCGLTGFRPRLRLNRTETQSKKAECRQDCDLCGSYHQASRSSSLTRCTSLAKQAIRVFRAEIKG